MVIDIKKLGPITSGKINLNKLTVICGENNSGKTYLSYTLFGILKFLRGQAAIDIEDDKIEKLFKKGFISIDLNDYVDKIGKYKNKLSNEYTKICHEVFSEDIDIFKETKIKIDDVNFQIDSSKELMTYIGSSDEQIISLHKLENSSIVDITREDDDEDIPIRIVANFVKNAIGSLLFMETIQRPIAISSERTGISLFYKDLDLNRNQLINYILKNKKIDPMSLLNTMTSSYAEPISFNIDFIRDYENHKKRKGVLVNNRKLMRLWEKILGGKLKYNKTDIIQIIKDSEGYHELPLPITSSSIKSLIALDIYIRYYSRVNDIIIIDEPEMNLHPTKQIMLARLLVMMINSDINVLITTHSDYILKELNNSIMLSNNFNGKDDLIKKYKLDKEFSLKADDVNSYYIDDNGVILELKKNNTGIDYDRFDDTIIKQNEISEELYYNIEKQY